MMGSGSLFSNGLNGFCGERKQMLRCGHQPCTPVAPQLHPAPLNSREGVTRQPAPMSLGCASARPDGYTLLEATSTNAWNVALYRNLSFDFIRDLAPVAGVCRYAGVMVVNPSVPAETVPEFIVYAKANPGKINMGSGGAGTPSHLYGELFKKMTGVDLVHVPYRGGGPAVIDLLSGQVQVFFGTVSVSIDHIRSGKLRALGVTTSTRMDVLPDVPPMSDFVPGYEANGWEGIVAPKDVPPEIIDTLSKEINAALVDANFKSRLANLGVEPFANSPVVEILRPPKVKVMPVVT